MTTSTSPTTELDAVNLMLQVIGESPLSTLNDVTVADAILAKSVLSETSREVQSKGWHFNTEDEYPLVPSVDGGEITLPINCLRVDTDGNYRDLNVVQRGNRLYNKGTHSYSFDKPITVQMVVCLPYEELPETARHYIAIKAARKFQARTVGSDALYQYSVQDENEARVAFKKSEGVTADHNILTDSYSVYNILKRR
jgi:hypothetical protein